MTSLCGTNCSSCDNFKCGNCNGCQNAKGCPAGKRCFVYNYIKTGGTEYFDIFKQQLINEFNELNIPGMPKITQLLPIIGSDINFTYHMPNGQDIELLNNNEIYLCNQVECEFNDGEIKRCFGLAANASFLLVSKYGQHGDSPEVVIYKRR